MLTSLPGVLPLQVTLTFTNTSLSGLAAMQAFHPIAGLADPLATNPGAYSEFLYTVATTPTR